MDLRLSSASSLVWKSLCLLIVESSSELSREERGESVRNACESQTSAHTEYK